MIIFNHSPFIDFLLKKCYNIYIKKEIILNIIITERIDTNDTS